MKSWGPRPFETVGDASLSSLCVVPPFLYPPLNELPTNNVNERADFSTSQPSPLCSIPFSLSLFPSLFLLLSTLSFFLKPLGELYRRCTRVSTHTNPSRNVSFLRSYISSFGGLRATREAFSRATFPLRTLRGVVRFFFFFFGRGEQIVVTLIVTRTLLCDKIPAFYFHPTIKDPSSDLKLGFLSLHVREHGSSEWNMMEHIVHRLRSDSGKMCEEIRLSSAYTISSNRMRQFNDLPGARVYRPSSRVSSPRLRASKHGIEFTIGG